MEKKEATGFNKGDSIVYKYTHWLNSRACTTIRKKAEFVRYVKKRRGNVYAFNPNPKVVIQVNGNKKTSTVRLSDIELLTTQPNP